MLFWLPYQLSPGALILASTVGIKRQLCQDVREHVEQCTEDGKVIQNDFVYELDFLSISTQRRCLLDSWFPQYHFMLPVLPSHVRTLAAPSLPELL